MYNALYPVRLLITQSDVFINQLLGLLVLDSVIKGEGTLFNIRNLHRLRFKFDNTFSIAFRHGYPWFRFENQVENHFSTRNCPDYEKKKTAMRFSRNKPLSNMIFKTQRCELSQLWKRYHTLHLILSAVIFYFSTGNSTP